MLSLRSDNFRRTSRAASLTAAAAITAVALPLSVSGAAASPLYGSVEGAWRGSSEMGSGAALGSSMPNYDPDNFYSSLPEYVEGTPGQVLKTGPSTLALGLPFVDLTNSKATRVAYVSTDSNGKTIPVTGTIYESSKPWRGKGPRPLMLIAPGTQGSSNACAPGKLAPWGLEYEALPALQALMRGWDVALTDLPGLGTRAQHTYMNRVAQGNATLDIGRAAKNMGIRGVSDKTPVATWGYSQGGGASASALELADSYAPELNLVAGYAGGIPANLGVVAGAIDNGALAAALGYAINGLLYSDPELREPIYSKLNDKGRKLLEQTKDECVPESLLRHAYKDTRTLTKDGSSLTELMQEEPIASAVQKQLIGTLSPSVPVYVGQGKNDDTIPASQARDLARSWLGKGAKVYYREQNVPSVAPLVDHVIPMLANLSPAVLWLEKVINGQPYELSTADQIPR